MSERFWRDSASEARKELGKSEVIFAAAVGLASFFISWVSRGEADLLTFLITLGSVGAAAIAWFLGNLSQVPARVYRMRAEKLDDAQKQISSLTAEIEKARADQRLRHQIGEQVTYGLNRLTEHLRRTRRANPIVNPNAELDPAIAREAISEWLERIERMAREAGFENEADIVARELLALNNVATGEELETEARRIRGSLVDLMVQGGFGGL